MKRNERIKMMPESLVPWYREKGRSLPWREDKEPYHIWVSEIMLQQTRIEAVKPYYAEFLRELPDISSLASAEEEKLQKLWEGLGYYSRVRNLKKAAQQIMEEHGGRFPEKYQDILKLKGIGEYTAGAIGSICFELPTPAVDGNVLRVVSRITGDERPVTEEKVKKAVRKELAEVYPEGACGDFTQAIMELGEMVCLPNGSPDCNHCPCSFFCSSRDGGWKRLPVREKKKERRKEFLTVFLLSSGEKLAIRRRSQKGLLRGMWEFPNVSGILTEEEAMRQLDAWGCTPEEIMDISKNRHIFTHVEWEMLCYAVNCRTESDFFCWKDEHQMKEEIALPTAFRKLMEKGDK